MKKLLAILIVLVTFYSALPAMASDPLTQSHVMQKALALAEQYGVQLGIVPH